MKRVFGILLLGVVALASCSKKTRPTTSVPAKKTTPPVTVLAPPISDSVVTAPTPVPKPETPAITLPAGMAPMIVIDDKGRIVTAKEKLPEEVADKVNYSRISRGFSPVQRQNLIYRFKMIPPRVLFVPDQLASKGAKGTYVIYKKKFWYWKKEDGLFHLDETYYQ
ncbi:hypothetical protein [Sediminibacterium soli]|uniref:hypothetical protein n=1 Tax=Sediminibacterium soli TaxID=2698829 RepID=UPI00137B0623|nr:hypothetical protein [Sediminibacterium soli]NCI47469.1 hypothetical protein [Sediminibacterium soli]